MNDESMEADETSVPTRPKFNGDDKKMIGSRAFTGTGTGSPLGLAGYIQY